MADSCSKEVGEFANTTINLAHAQAYYACKYFQSVQDTNLIRNIIAAGQAVTQIYFADKQYQIAKQNQDRLDTIANTDLDRSGKLFAQFEKALACEDKFMAAACDIDVAPPDYDAIVRRITATVKQQYTQIKKKVKECYPVQCAAAACHELQNIAIQESNSIRAGVEAAYRKEHALWETRKATKLEIQYRALGLARGSVTSAQAALAGAQSAAQQAAQINPYQGWIQAVNGIAETGQRISLQDALSYRGMGINVGSNIQQPASIGSGVQVTTGQTNTAANPIMYGSDSWGDINYSDNPANITGDGSTGNDQLNLNMQNAPNFMMNYG
jgi:hypothetical protein